jgi:hypothetical protein
MPMNTSRPPWPPASWIMLVEHRDRHVEALDRELLLAQVGLVHEALERVDLREAAQELALSRRGPSAAERAGLDLLAQPDALAVRGDVLDLVGDRAAVGLAQVRQRVGERRARDADAQDLGRDLAMISGVRPSGSGRAPGRPRARSRAGPAARRGGRACGAP